MDQESSRPRVLVVDDEPFIRRLTARILSEAGYDPTGVDARIAANTNQAHSRPPIVHLSVTIAL